ncbi:39S ribosomal protein L41-A, mitochondrial-like [Amborella trichopoda]|uniref:39S ribosomal protein L41-A, mitochondrial-like n=1 Tax=Amborella trichopoda TaxID=13333 RepID=UPI0005D3B65D|nr:39S ribosomal protein L41-A, mitochondrial-like [Amborella trichopoda]XP_011624642.1 39S ribosomal protein L41-A, mitochondrial-like [Amborella trichopoda]XP_020525261.1 39S ribosomal protein L41-A, mitochondrial-like [Amborella trichopoda]XP_020525263.1 39S ribosomal protein L41-A, mitochondrial-like [Amborella trichopoda]|eukprot:XP_011624640.1 39S ribosomal protein L41-A, mitochondrial-like [Amborella trichopoda]
MALGLILGIGRSMRRKRSSALDILTSKRSPRDYYKGKNVKPTGFHTRKGGYVVMDEKLPQYVIPDLTNFKLKPYVAQQSWSRSEPQTEETTAQAANTEGSSN